jgi:lysophospholipase L1-like esterase
MSMFKSAEPFYRFQKATLLTALILVWTSCNDSISTMEETQQQATPNTNTPFRTGPVSYLALGDSYTIGQGVDPSQNYPNLLTSKLRNRGITINDPVVIAVTGWTTQDLLQAMRKAQLDDKQFDLLTLLIGVNNQYRGQSLEEYEKDLSELMIKSLALVGDDKNRIIVISIPDWGVTPYASSLARDKAMIAAEIDRFNEKNKSLAEKTGVRYLEITEEYRSLGHMEQYLAVDGLHPSEKVYDRWAERLTEIIIDEMNIR